MKYQIEKRYFKYTPKRSYRYGKPEGVCLHFTANYNSTIEGELSYMAKNTNKAFVQAFVDQDHCIECADPGMGAYGAGKYANRRFIHIELCVAHNPTDFERSFDRYCWMAAYYLQKYNRPLTYASSNGNGTLWTHRHVTNYLGGTTHTDPFNYLAKWGVSWQTICKRVAKHYNEMKGTNMGGTDMIGRGIESLQASLNTLGYVGANGKSLVVDGITGKNTTYATKNFQSDNGLVRDGIAGAKTWEAINQKLKEKREKENLKNAAYAVQKSSTGNTDIDEAIANCEKLLASLKKIKEGK
jgi:hypothetical protein